MNHFHGSRVTVYLLHAAAAFKWIISNSEPGLLMQTKSQLRLCNTITSRAQHGIFTGFWCCSDPVLVIISLDIWPRVPSTPTISSFAAFFNFLGDLFGPAVIQNSKSHGINQKWTGCKCQAPALFGGFSVVWVQSFPEPPLLLMHSFPVGTVRSAETDWSVDQWST